MDDLRRLAEGELGTTALGQILEGERGAVSMQTAGVRLVEHVALKPHSGPTRLHACRRQTIKRKAKPAEDTADNAGYSDAVIDAPSREKQVPAGLLFDGFPEAQADRGELGIVHLRIGQPENAGVSVRSAAPVPSLELIEQDDRLALDGEPMGRG